jgi:membrane protease YdiL (CAAX protease family)
MTRPPSLLRSRCQGPRSRWWHVIADERAAIQEGPAPRVSTPVAVGVTAGVVIAGNALVVLQRRAGGNLGGSLTTIVMPLLGTAGSVALIAAGWRRRDLGLAFQPRRDLAGLRRPASALAGTLSAASIATLLRGGRHDGISDGLTVVRVVVGTALGEELIHRGVLFALWAATGESTKTVAVANAVAFGAWHIMAATSETRHPRPARIVVPMVAGTALFLWARARSGSVFGSSLLHAATNLPFVLLRLWSEPS